MIAHLPRLAICLFLLSFAYGLGNLSLGTAGWGTEGCRLQGHLDLVLHPIFSCPALQCDDLTQCTLSEFEGLDVFGNAYVEYECSCGTATPYLGCLAIGRVTWDEDGRHVSFECVFSAICDPSGEPSCFRTEMSEWTAAPQDLCWC